MDVKAETLERAAEPRAISRTALNFWIDLVTAVLFALLLGSSFIMKWILPPGTCDDAGVKVWLGHSRHWWGDIHFWAAMLLIAVIVVHIWLHWSWVLGTWRKLLGSVKSPSTWGVLAAMAALLALPFVVPAYYLEVPEDTTLAAGADADSSATTAPATVAPCGVPGLSCADCPAAGDRLFGGSCSGSAEEAAEENGDAAGDEAGEEGESAEDDTADATTEDGTANSECSTCPFSGDCGGDGSCADENDDADTGEEA